jgi:hypothetical protein
VDHYVHTSIFRCESWHRGGNSKKLSQYLKSMNINHVAKFSALANVVGGDKMMTEEMARLLDDERNSEVISINES